MKKRFPCFLLFFVFLKNYAFFETYKAINSFEDKNYAKAKSLLIKKILKDPNKVECNYNLADVFYKQEDYIKAEKHFKRAIEYNKSNERLKEYSYFNLGNTLAYKGELEESILQYEEALKINPDNEKTKHNLDIVKKMLERKNNEQNQPQDNKQNNGSDSKQDQNNNNSNDNQQDNSNKDNNEQNDKNDSDSENQNNQKNDSTENNSDQNNQKNEKQDNQSNGEDSQGNDSQKEENIKDDLNNNKGKEDRKQDGEKSKDEQSNQNSIENGRDSLENNSNEVKDPQEYQNISNHNKPQNTKQNQTTKEKNHLQEQIEKTEKNLKEAGVSERDMKILEFLDEQDSKLGKRLIKIRVDQDNMDDDGKKNW